MKDCYSAPQKLLLGNVTASWGSGRLGDGIKLCFERTDAMV